MQLRNSFTPLIAISEQNRIIYKWPSMEIMDDCALRFPVNQLFGPVGGYILSVI